jgi:hypothetical protein
MDRLFVVLVAAAALSATACQTTPIVSTPQPPPTGEFRGLVSFDGVERPASLSVVPDDEGLRAILHVADEALAFGAADWLGGLLYVGFDYNTASDRGSRAEPCAGRLHMVTEPTSIGVTLTGDLHARDCTGSARGSFNFGLYSAIP